MSVTVELKGEKELQRALNLASVEAQARVGKAVLKTAVNLRTDVIRRIQRGPATGRTYELTNPTRTHQASAKGEAPATDQGGLVGSIKFNKVGPMTATVGSEIVYAAALEFGHDYGKGRIIEPRPYFTPAVEAARDEYIKSIEEALIEVIR
jgi:phage gpG-like protein